MRVHCVFECSQANRRYLAGPVFEITSVSRSRSAFALLITQLAKMPVDDIANTNLDLNNVVGQRLDVMLKPDRDGFARIATMTPLSF